MGIKLRALKSGSPIMRKRRRNIVAVSSIVALGLIVAGIFWAINFVDSYRYPIMYEKEVTKCAKEYDVDKHLILAIIKTESNFVFDAQSQKSAKGLMQLMDDTAIWVAKKMGMKDFDVNNITDPQVNIAMGTWYISYLMERFDSQVENALAAYNAGPGNVEKWLKNSENSKDGVTLSYIPFEETRNYVEKVKLAQGEYKRIYK